VEDIEYNRMLVAEERHWWYAGLHDLVLRFARLEAHRLGRPMSMLDAGCGTGRLCQLLSPLGEVNGCDIHPLAVEFTSRRGICHVLKRDLAIENVGDAQFDLITMMDVLYHRRITGELATLRALHNALRPGGALMLQVPAFEVLRGSHDVAVHTRRRYRRSQVARMLAGAGFHVEMATYRLCALLPPLFAWRLCSRAMVPFSSTTPMPSDVAHLPPDFLNALLLRCIRVENRLIARGVRLPFGTSVFALARKGSQ